jgi:iron complex transport system ATP-binding protein
MLELKDIGFKIKRRNPQTNDLLILKDINLDWGGPTLNHFNVIMGPNGAGKSTLLKVATGVLKPTSGEVLLNKKNINTYSHKALSLRRAVLSQHFEITFPLSVKEVVTMGRYPHFENIPSQIDRQIVDSALEKVTMTHKINQNYMTLSGGEKQKVQMARVLAQIWNTPHDEQHKYLFLDEPTTSLDIRYQLQILDIAKELLNYNTTIVAVLHDINLSFQYGTQFFFLNQGALVFQTTDKLAVSEGLIEQIFEVKAKRMGETGVWMFGG